ncbi:hypothetical protein [Tamlana sp. s12]|uniref:hypothetical protein n=1 Tax=Tamlana sp. s12 TaxID=1630406 RepID=UPI00293D88D1|nr:hypothetical protein [Tamlana sp. s12]
MKTFKIVHFFNYNVKLHPYKYLYLDFNFEKEFQMKKAITTTNPYTNDIIKSYDYFSEQTIADILKQADNRFHKWKTVKLSKKARL